jgi:hypothetical protein
LQGTLSLGLLRTVIDQKAATGTLYFNVEPKARVFVPSYFEVFTGGKGF